MNIGIVGHGVVGSVLSRFIRRSPAHRIVVYDKFQTAHSSSLHKESVNSCDLVFLCVPTPSDPDGTCDVSAVEECAEWITCPLCVRSTIPPGTTDRLSAKNGRLVGFSPEYIGESRFHGWREEAACGFLIVGGPDILFQLVRSLYESCSQQQLRYYHTSARTAELCKYMENCFLATKVAFVNQFFDIAHALNVEFDELRNLWLADPRIGDSHTRVTAERGFRGRCLPKDLAALVATMKYHSGAPLLESVLSYNRTICEEADRNVCRRDAQTMTCFENHRELSSGSISSSRDQIR
jgi:UDPglucose 6-dehydrogenase